LFFCLCFFCFFFKKKKNTPFAFKAF